MPRETCGHTVGGMVVVVTVVVVGVGADVIVVTVEAQQETKGHAVEWPLLNSSHGRLR